MAKFYGEVGFAASVETAPGVWEDIITERKLYGDVLRISRSLQGDDKVNEDISVGNNISVVADAYANGHFFAIKYVKWSGVYWSVDKVDVLPPRLNLTLGGVYNGIKATPTPDPGVDGS